MLTSTTDATKTFFDEVIEAQKEMFNIMKSKTRN